MQATKIGQCGRVHPLDHMLAIAASCQCPVFPIGKKMDRVAPDQGHQGLQVEKIQAKAKERRYLLSPVGRRIPIRSMYYALVFLEQGSEADVMKLAETIFYFDVCPRMGWRYAEDYAFVAHVHRRAADRVPPGDR
jgi:hypothetical protein